MCGISAIFANSIFPVSEIEAMTNIISHRGPDDEGYLIIDNNNKIHTFGGKSTPNGAYTNGVKYAPKSVINSDLSINGVIGLGHRRLSIIELSELGHMPMCDEDGIIWITYNGEIYNYIELRNELIELGAHFSSNTDTEVIIKAYQRWGTACLTKFVGMWAFVLVDLKNNKLFASRDRFGIKPLYYYISQTGRLHFASEIKQFTVLESWQNFVNVDRCLDFLLYAITDHTDETMFRNVFQIPAGYFYYSTLFEKNRMRKLDLTKWYEISTNGNSISYLSAIEKFKIMLTDAVKLHMRSDVKLGTSLSGGIDSSSIVCLEKKILNDLDSKEEIHTFSCCSNYERFSEKSWCDIVIGAVDVTPHFIYPKFNLFFEELNRVLWHQDEPFSTQSIFFSYSLFQAVKEDGIKVLLNGQGADEYLGGYSQFAFISLFANLRSLKFRYAYDNYKLLKERNSNHSILTLLMELYKAMPFLGIMNKVYNFTRKFSKPYPFINRRYDKIAHPLAHAGNKRKTKRNEVDFQMFQNPLPRFLHWEDRNSMAASVESRIPFLDHRLVDFCSGMPSNYFDSDGVTKKLVRDAMHGVIPDEIYNRRDKMGYTTPEEMWVTTDYSDLFRTKLKAAVDDSCGFVDPSILQSFDNMIVNKSSYDNIFLRVVIFSSWLKLFSLKVEVSK